MRYYQLKVNGRKLEENYGTLDEAAAAYTTAVDALRSIGYHGVKVQLFAEDGPPPQEIELARAVTIPWYGYETELMYLDCTGGECRIVDENLAV